MRRSLEACVVGTVAENLRRNRICNTLSLSDEVVPLLKLIASFLASSEIVANDDDDDDIVVIFLLVKCGQSLAAIKAQTTSCSTVCVGVCEPEQPQTSDRNANAVALVVSLPP